jgi:hypothetical protein
MVVTQDVLREGSVLGQVFAFGDLQRLVQRRLLLVGVLDRRRLPPRLAWRRSPMPASPSAL